MVSRIFELRALPLKISVSMRNGGNCYYSGKGISIYKYDAYIICESKIFILDKLMSKLLNICLTY